MKDLRFALRNATLDRAKASRPLQEKLFTDPVEKYARWPSGLHSDFDAVFDGFVGVTVVAGRGGCGKSSMALSCALENALQPGTAVFYLDAENDLGLQQWRAQRWFGSQPLYEVQMIKLAGSRFHWVQIMPGHTWDQAMHYIAERVSLEHERVLIVVDSINTFARYHKGKEYENSSLIYMACNTMARDTLGKISTLVLSELNGSGEVRGREGEHHGTLVLLVERDHDLGDDCVAMKMLKHRAGPLKVELGSYLISAKHTRLVKLDAERGLWHADA